VFLKQTSIKQPEQFAEAGISRSQNYHFLSFTYLYLGVRGGAVG
jgi:hypothetical protein